MSQPSNGRPRVPGLPADALRLLDAERGAPLPSRAVQDRVRARVAASVVAAGALGTAAAAGAATSAATVKAAGAGVIGTLAVKTSIVAVVVAAGVTGGLALRSGSEPAAVVTATAESARPGLRRAPAAPAAIASPPVVTPPPVVEPLPAGDPPVAVPLPAVVIAPPAAAAPSVAPPRRAAAPSRASLEDEHAPIAAALAALGQRQPDRALAALAQHERHFRDGQLAEEREALWIRALAARGDGDEARARAERFRRRFPTSIQDEVIAAALAAIP